MATGEIIDIFYRSRITLLDHLEKEGYTVTPYRKFSVKEIGEMVKGGAPALNMELVKGDGDSKYTCRVVYTINKIKQKIIPFTQAVVDTETGFDPSNTEVIILTNEPIAPNFHQAANTFWMTNGTRVRYFHAAAIINNPLHHFLVPKHEIVPKEQEEELLKDMYAKKKQLPIIRFHEDPIARMIGAFPGDIVKITRPSPTSGECILYRRCAL
jgi:DNA-directed RNA polymerase subunit H